MSAEQSPYEYFVESLQPKGEALPEEPQERGWDTRAIGAYLNAKGRPVFEPAFGGGEGFDVDYLGSTMELYPQRETVIFRDEDVEIRWFHAAPPTLINEPGRQGVTFVKQTADKLKNLSIETGGTVVFAIFPGLPEAPAKPYATPDPEVGTPEVSKPLPQTSGDGGKAKAEKDPRVELSGRVGKDPILKKTVKGGDVLTFSVAVANGTEKPDWHRMVAFGERALALSETLKRGDKVDVIGYQASSTRMETDKKTGEKIEKQYTFVRVATVTKPE